MLHLKYSKNSFLYNLLASFKGFDGYELEIKDVCSLWRNLLLLLIYILVAPVITLSFLIMNWYRQERSMVIFLVPTVMFLSTLIGGTILNINTLPNYWEILLISTMGYGLIALLVAMSVLIGYIIHLICEISIKVMVNRRTKKGLNPTKSRKSNFIKDIYQSIKTKTCKPIKWQ